MHIHNLEQWQHGHNFFVHRKQNEKNTRKVMGLTAVTMVVEIAAGVAFGSMALLADGWHMGAHVAAFLITLFPIAIHTSTPTIQTSPLAQARSTYSVVSPAL